MRLEWRVTARGFHKDTMRLLLLVCIVTPTIVVSDTAMDCDKCVAVNKTCYSKTYLFDLEGNFRTSIVLNEMAVLRSDGILYYSFEPLIKDPEYSKVGFVNLDNPTVHGILQKPKFTFNFTTIGMDQTKKIVYLGGSDGIYQFDTNLKNMSRFSSPGYQILSVTFKDTVYFVRQKDNESHEILQKDGGFISVLEDTHESVKEFAAAKLTVKKFVINNKNVVVFSSDMGLFASHLTKNSDLVRLSVNPFFRGLTLDLDGTVYAWWLDGIYKVVLESVLSESTIEKVADLPDIGCMTFDNSNNILITNERRLFRLTKTDFIFEKCKKAHNITTRSVFDNHELKNRNATVVKLIM